jgi:hypothetical protein
LPSARSLRYNDPASKISEVCGMIGHVAGAHRGTRTSALALGLLCLLPALAAQAAECDGGAIAKLRVGPSEVQLTALVTRRGLGPQPLITGDAGLRVRVIDANDPSRIVFQMSEPSARFATSGTTTKYDRQGAFQGTIGIKPERSQPDTVRLSLKTKAAAVGTLTGLTELRVEIDTEGACARSCVSSCANEAGVLRCDKSLRFEPFADEGYGALASPRVARTPFCNVAVDAAQRCDFLIDDHCLLPYPSSHLVTVDTTSPTFLRVQYGAQSLPRNTAGKYIDPADWNTLDGFSPGPMIMALFSDTGFPVDLGASRVAFHTDFARSLEADHPTVLLEVATGQRVLHFAELDANTTMVDRQAFIIRPGRRLRDATRYIVAIRGLVDTQGNPLRARHVFRALRGEGGVYELARACGQPCADAIVARRPAFADILTRLADNGVDPAGLILAWDFTTASTPGLTGWLRAMRDQAFALPTPTFTVDSTDDGGGSGFSADTWVRIEGTFQAPLFMTADAPGARINLVGGVPAQNGFATVPYVVDLPRSVVNPGGAPTPSRATLWGHGLLGDRFQLGGLAEVANDGQFIVAAVDMQGMSTPDVVGAIIPSTQDFSLFHRVPERLQQGLLNHLLLGRLLADPANGFNSHAAFRFGPGATPVIDTTQVFYSGGSQGGIFGATIMAVATNFERGFLAVPASNYSTLLNRATPFQLYRNLIVPNYPDPLDQQVLVALAQQLWDRADPHAYLPHIVPGTLADPPTPHKVLIHMATYDSQVSNLGTEIMVRSLGIPQVGPVRRSFFQIPEATAPFDGSALVEIDNQRGFSRCNEPGADNPGATCTTNADCPGPGDPPVRTRCDSGIPPLENLIPPFDNGAHGSASLNTAPIAQVNAFLRTGGRIENPCTGPCDPN